MQTGWAAMRFGWSAYVIPVLFAFSPSLILIGAPVEIAVAIVTAVVGVWLISAALAGYFSRRLTGAMRAAFVVFGFMALVPAGAFEGAIWSDLVGVVGGLALMAREVIRGRRRQSEEPA